MRRGGAGRAWAATPVRWAALIWLALLVAAGAGSTARPAWAQAVPQPVSTLAGESTAADPAASESAPTDVAPEAEAEGSGTPAAGFTPLTAAEAEGTPQPPGSDKDAASSTATAEAAAAEAGTAAAEAEASATAGVAEEVTDTAALQPTTPVEPIAATSPPAGGAGLDAIVDAAGNLFGFFVLGFAGAFVLGLIVAVLAALRHAE